MDNEKGRTENGAADGSLLLKAVGISKTYNRTRAVSEVSLDIGYGETVSLVGGNGAGKSTLTRILSGVTTPDCGELTFHGEKIDLNTFSASDAIQRGIRVVYQEISLCTNLSVYENFYVELNALFKGKRNWRRQARDMARRSIDAIFPDSGINVEKECGMLTIAQQQMVEIARAFADPALKMLILDEPTSSLASLQADQLLAYVQRKKKEGISFVYISHRLKEILSLADSILVMENGGRVWYGTPAETSEEDLVSKMSGNHGARKAEAADAGLGITRYEAGKINEAVGVKLTDVNDGGLENLSFEAHGGEIVGISGLEGNGQKELLRKIFASRSGRTRGAEIRGKVAYVTGDRKKEGNFPLMSVLENAMITKLVFGRLSRVTKASELTDTAVVWFDKLQIKCDGLDEPITDLSGGNQQKVLVARAMVADVDIILLDDPTRGVDVVTKRQIYSLLTEFADAGKLVIFYSSESLEMELCSRVEVLRYNTIVRELTGEKVTSDNVIEASFAGEDLLKKDAAQDVKKNSSFGRVVKNPAFVPFLAMMGVYLLSGIKAPAVFSLYGVELLLKGSAPLIVLSLAQMFIVGLGHVDLGAGYYMGFVNVICATLLYTKPALGGVIILAAMLAYACMGLLVYYRNVPAVVVTLGSSFIWSGIALTIQRVPGGRVPAWLTGFFKLDIGVPIFIVLTLLITAGVFLFYRSKYGTVMKGFGNNPMALVRSGWSQPKAYFSVYLSSAVLVTLAGLIMSGLTGGSDINASGTYTMQTVAAVIVGGGHLLGGRVSVFGAVFGAVTFSLIASLLGFMKVSSELTAAVQGAILIIILALRIIKVRRSHHEE